MHARKIKNIKAVIFDLDGTLYRGMKAISGASECIRQLRAKGVCVFFLSNTGTNKREEIAAKLCALGIDAKADEIYSSAYGAARYIVEKHGKGSGFYAVAEKSMIEELESFGLVYDENKPKAVVVSLDRTVTYEKIAKAYLLIKKGAEFIATNKDPDYPVEDGTLPGAGAIVGAVEASVRQRPVLIGKPTTRLISWLLKDNCLKKKDVVLVGDSLLTDISLAKKIGIKSVLVLSGIATKEEKMFKTVKPDFIIESVKDLPLIIE